MKIISLSEYNAYLTDKRSNPTKEAVLCEGRRGEYYLYKEFCMPWICGTTDAIQSNEASTKLIVDNEISICWDGTECDHLITVACYENDTRLLNAYKSLQLNKLARKQSRNNVCCNVECCLAFWLFNDNILNVVSRSMDLNTAGKTDVLLIDGIAKKLNATACNLYNLQPHTYKDTSKIARRKDDV